MSKGAEDRTVCNPWCVHNIQSSTFYYSTFFSTEEFTTQGYFTVFFCGVKGEGHIFVFDGSSGVWFYLVLRQNLPL